MRKILLLALFALSGCGLFDAKITIHDLNVDFPTTDSITVDVLKQTFCPSDHFGSSFLIQDSVIFILEHNTDNFGHCYSLNSGNMISKLPNRGNALNEMRNANYFSFYKGDSIQFGNYNGGEIKIFSTKDILSKPAGELECSTAKLHPEIVSSVFMKIDSMILALPILAEKPYVICDGEVVTYFGEHEMDLINFEGVKKSKNDKQLSMIFVNGLLASSGDKVVIAASQGIALNVLDIAQKKVISKRYYCKYLRGSLGFSSICDFETTFVKCTDENIYCIIEDKTKTGQNFDCYILVYDWQLNPVKRYYLEGGTYSYSLSEDCKTVYRFVGSDEDQKLYEHKL